MKPTVILVHGAFAESASWDRVIDPLHAAGLRVNTWTVDDPGRVAALARLGVDAVITNVPDVARAVLSAG